jgi:hypothetical protein
MIENRGMVNHLFAKISELKLKGLWTEERKARYPFK